MRKNDTHMISMASMASLNIYPDAISHACGICESAICDIRDFAGKLGYGLSAESLELHLDNFSEELLDALDENGLDPRDITNSIISGAFGLTKNILEATGVCSDLGLTFCYYVNCDDSHLYVECAETGETYDSGNVNDLLHELLARHLCDIIKDRMLDGGEISSSDLTEERVEALGEYIRESLSDFDEADIAACYCEREITGTIRETAEYALGLRE